MNKTKENQKMRKDVVKKLHFLLIKLGYVIPDQEFKNFLIGKITKGVILTPSSSR